MSNTTITLNFDPLEGMYVEQGEGVRKSKKYINMDDLKDILLTEIRVDTGILPFGTIYNYKGDGKNILVILTQPSVRRVLYHNRGERDMSEYMIPFPYMVFGLVIAGGTVRETLNAAARTPIASMDTLLYQSPFGNVWRENQRVCWGRTRLPQISTSVQASGVPNLFFSAPFNGDLSDNAFVDFNHENNNLGHLFERLNGEQYFPSEILVENGNMKKFIDRLHKVNV